MNKNRIKWLYDELPKLVNDGVISSNDAENIHKYYGDVDEAGRTKMLMSVFGILGAVLIGGGIILLLAKNWAELSRPVRTVLSFIPLLIGQIMCAWVIWRKKDSAAWREGTASFLFISIGASVSLIGQTYNIPGDTGSFVLTWMLLGFPLIYLMNVTVPGIFYLCGITVWASIMQQSSGQAVLFWVLLGILLPYVYKRFKENSFSNHFVFLSWSVALSLCVSIGVTLEKVLPGLWIVVYSGYFVTLYISGVFWFRNAYALWQRPFQVVGGAGVLIISYLLTYEWPWRDIGWDNYRYSSGYHQWAGYFDYLIGAVFAVSALYLIYMSLRRKKVYNLFFGVSIVLSIAAYVEVSIASSWIAIIMYNLYLIALGVETVVSGIRNRQLGTTNGGMLIIAVLAVMRFFDSSMGFVERGIAFILVGTGFLVSNLLILKKRRREIE